MGELIPNRGLLKRMGLEPPPLPPNMSIMNYRPSSGLQDIIPGAHEVPMRWQSRDRLIGPNGMPYPSPLDIDELKRCIDNRIYLFSCYYRPFSQQYLNKLVEDNFHDDAKVEELYRSLSREELDAFKEDIIGIPLMMYHRKAAEDDPLGNFSKTCGVVTNVLQTKDGSTLVGVRLYNTPDGIWACGMLEGGLRLGGSLHHKRVGWWPNSRISFREYSVCLHGRRPNTGLVSIWEYNNTPPPLPGTSRVYEHPMVEQIIELEQMGIPINPDRWRMPTFDNSRPFAISVNADGMQEPDPLTDPGVISLAGDLRNNASDTLKTVLVGDGSLRKSDETSFEKNTKSIENSFRPLGQIRIYEDLETRNSLISFLCSPSSSNSSTNSSSFNSNNSISNNSSFSTNMSATDASSPSLSTDLASAQATVVAPAPTEVAVPAPVTTETAAAAVASTADAVVPPVADASTTAAATPAADANATNAPAAAAAAAPTEAAPVATTESVVAPVTTNEASDVDMADDPEALMREMLENVKRENNGVVDTATILAYISKVKQTTQGSAAPASVAATSTTNAAPATETSPAPVAAATAPATETSAAATTAATNVVPPVETTLAAAKEAIAPTADSTSATDASTAAATTSVVAPTDATMTDEEATVSKVILHTLDETARLKAEVEKLRSELNASQKVAAENEDLKKKLAESVATNNSFISKSMEELLQVLSKVSGKQLPNNLLKQGDVSQQTLGSIFNNKEIVSAISVCAAGIDSFEARYRNSSTQGKTAEALFPPEPAMTKVAPSAAAAAAMNLSPSPVAVTPTAVAAPPPAAKSVPAASNGSVALHAQFSVKKPMPAETNLSSLLKMIAPAVKSRKANDVSAVSVNSSSNMVPASEANATDDVLLANKLAASLGSKRQKLNPNSSSVSAPIRSSGMSRILTGVLAAHRAQIQA